MSKSTASDTVSLLSCYYFSFVFSLTPEITFIIHKWPRSHHVSTPLISFKFVRHLVYGITLIHADNPWLWDYPSTGHASWHVLEAPFCVWFVAFFFFIIRFVRYWFLLLRICTQLQRKVSLFKSYLFTFTHCHCTIFHFRVYAFYTAEVAAFAAFSSFACFNFESKCLVIFCGKLLKSFQPYLLFAPVADTSPEMTNEEQKQRNMFWSAYCIHTH